jgi:aspartyl-tRNA synthetase
MEAYGSDKPDTRYPLVISDITHHAKTRRLDLLYNSSPEAEIFNSAERVQVTLTRWRRVSRATCDVDLRPSLSLLLLSLPAQHSTKLLQR